MDLRLLPYAPQRDVYRLLGVEPGADRATIADACRRLARTFHPDRNASPRATEEMQVINAVRALLADARSRAEYDHARRTFLASQAPRRPAHSPTAVLLPRRSPPRGLAWERAARATLRGMLAGVTALAPERCAGCDEPVSAEHRFCGWCGEPRRASRSVAGAVP